jgi:hypothetical protein
MLRRALLSSFVGILIAGSAAAQSGFRWQTGQVLTYRVEQVTSASEVLGDTKTESKTRLSLTKRWKVAGVDASGVATVQLSLAELRLENVRPDGETLVFDSAHPDQSTPEMSKELSGFVGPVLAVLRLDARGKVVEVKESRFGPASRYEVELPFLLVLPEAGLKEGQTWDRAYAITLEPPQGTGEKFDATQSYSCRSVASGLATIAMTTAVKNPPENALERVPLLQLQPRGEIVFDTRLGLLRGARLTIDSELKGHQGEGSSYHFQSLYTAEYVGSK